MKVTIGRGSYVDEGIKIEPHPDRYPTPYDLTIGNYCSIANQVKFYLIGDHKHTFITTYPLEKLGGTQAGIGGNITIGNDVWIGTRCVLVGPVTIGDGACIGANSVISKDIPPYAIAVGGGRITRYRFTPEQIKALEEIKWWNWSEDKIKRNVHLLELPIDEFIEASKHI